MPGPIVFISHNTVKEGKLEGFRDAFASVAEAMDAEKPGTVVFLAFAGDDGSEVSVVHVFPDAEAMGQHLQGVQERMGTAVEFIQTKGYEIYGVAERAGARGDARVRRRGERSAARAERSRRRLPAPRPLNALGRPGADALSRAGRRR